MAGGSLWRTDARTLTRLVAGLWIFGTGEAALVVATLGNSPWTVLAEGVSEQTGVGIGEVTVALSFVVLLLWIPLRQRPGLGTVLNAIIVGIALGVTLSFVGEPSGLGLRLGLIAAGIALVGAGSGLYLTSGLGPGPRDGLMTGLHGLTGRSLRLVRTSIEVAVTASGALLGGTVGVGTLAFAMLIGPSVQFFVGVGGGLDRPGALGTLRVMADEREYDIRLDDKYGSLTLIDIPREMTAHEPWFNQTLTTVNDACVRLGIIEGDFHWHKHDDEDEFFLVLEGQLVIDLEDSGSVTLDRHQGYTVPRGVSHRTRAPQRTTILMVEAADVVPTGD